MNTHITHVHRRQSSETSTGGKVQGLKGPCSLQALCLWGGKGYNYTPFIPPPLLFAENTLAPDPKQLLISQTKGEEKGAKLGGEEKN